MTEIKRPWTRGPWVACERGDYTDDGIVVLGDDMRVAVVNTDQDAALISAAPDLAEALMNFEIKGPDADGLVWLVMHGHGTTGKGMVQIGSNDSLVAQVALALEENRRSALRKAGLEGV